MGKVWTREGWTGGVWMGGAWILERGWVVCGRLIRGRVGRVMCMDEAVVVLVRVDAISRV
ncbi:unnamed protein product [Brassica napus]|uniref:(rape) hypothetical protein n=1 Tax=Brassica napus TaxID=3708 RepID=A0A816RMN1_BRANA|nr:unnamed protein product [Brassica napus]